MGDERTVQRVLGDRILGVTSRIVEAGQGNELTLVNRSIVKVKRDCGVLQFSGEGLSCSSMVLGRWTMVKLKAGDDPEIITMAERTRVTTFLNTGVEFIEKLPLSDAGRMKGQLSIKLDGEAEGSPFAVSRLGYSRPTRNLEWLVEDPQRLGAELLESIDDMLTRVENGLAQMPDRRIET